MQLLAEVYNRRCLVRLCIYFLYCVCGDRIKYNFLFGKQAGWGDSYLMREERGIQYSKLILI